MRKTCREYYFSVEGQTEKCYLEWLQRLINQSDEASCKVSFKIAVERNPTKYIKRLQNISKTEVWHLIDYESDSEEHSHQFKTSMDLMKTACTMGKQISYKLGYSNLTFDLWIILHRIDCYGAYVHRKDYLNTINNAYGKNFKSMDAYKTEKEFTKCLEGLSLNDVKAAVSRADNIMHQRKRDGHNEIEYRGYRYFRENPSMSIHEIVKKILRDCGLDEPSL